MEDQEKIEFMIDHLEREIELEERQEQFESITPQSSDDVLVLERENGQQEIVSAESEFTGSNTHA
jgi:hypothetical protein